jgi:hypothetical protein
VDDGSVLAEIVEAKIEESGALAVNHRHGQRRLGSQQSSERFQLKTRLEIDMSASKVRG